jgi:nitroreductase
MLLQATYMGIASCPIGGFDAGQLTEATSIPPGEIPALIIALGHCSDPAPERIRKPLT